MLDNRKRMYALQSWTVERKAKGWFIRRTDHDESWRGPYSSATSACLTIARQLKRELIKRDGLPSQALDPVAIRGFPFDRARPRAHRSGRASRPAGAI